MSSEPLSSGVCQEKSGFLFKHACAYLAEQACQQCRKPICSRHARILEDQLVCIACSKQGARPDGVRPGPTDNTYYDDSYSYAGRHYQGYGHYHSGYWGYWFLGRHGAHDRNDLTEADSANLALEGDEAFEQDMGES